jgi:hypothetical protein
MALPTFDMLAIFTSGYHIYSLHRFSKVRLGHTRLKENLTIIPSTVGAAAIFER